MLEHFEHSNQDWYSGPELRVCDFMGQNPIKRKCFNSQIQIVQWTQQIVVSTFNCSDNSHVCIITSFLK